MKVLPMRFSPLRRSSPPLIFFPFPPLPPDCFPLPAAIISDVLGDSHLALAAILNDVIDCSLLELATILNDVIDSSHFVYAMNNQRGSREKSADIILHNQRGLLS